MNSENDPVKRAQELARRPLPKRFYKSVSVREADGGFEIYLDERTLKTPGRKPLRLSSADVMHLIAEEWNAQAEQVDPATMPVTRLANTALDGVEAVRDAVAQEIASYACSDLVCYRAEGPEALVRAQEDAWNDLVAWFARAHGMALKLAAGVMPGAAGHQRGAGGRSAAGAARCARPGRAAYADDAERLGGDRAGVRCR